MRSDRLPLRTGTRGRRSVLRVFGPTVHYRGQVRIIIMDRPRLDYDRISGSYNSRYADNRLDGIERALAEIASRYGDPRVLEVGCGTGRWLDGLQRVTRSVYGVDASIGM